ncbi:MAG TPA: hypothetical protein VLA60_02680 [Nitrospirales bacterium]|nr:hypothetical protein [Nitrospirales bacterium]
MIAGVTASSEPHPDQKTITKRPVLQQRDSMKQAMHPWVTVLCYTAQTGRFSPGEEEPRERKNANIFNSGKNQE